MHHKFSFRINKTITTVVFVTIIMLLTLNWVVAIAKFQVNLPFLDQWDFSSPMFNEKGPIDFFLLKHGPHRQGIGYVVTSWIQHLSKWDTRVDSLWIASQLLIGVLLLLRLKYKISEKLSLGDLWIPIAGLSLLQFENIILVGNGSHSVTPFLLLAITANVWICKDSIWRVPLVGLLILFTVFTGFGLFIAAVWTGVLVKEVIVKLTECDWKNSITTIIGLMIAFLGWLWFFNDYTCDPASDGYSFPHHPYLDYLRFAINLYGARYGFIFPNVWSFRIGSFSLVVFVLLSVFFVYLFLGRRENRKSSIAIVFLFSSLVFVLFSGIGRVHLGIYGGIASRYMIFALLAWVGIGFGRELINNRFFSVVIMATCWAVALLPFGSLKSSHAKEWLGTAGLSEGWVRDLYRFRMKRILWADYFMLTNDWRQAQAMSPEGAHPRPELSGFDRKILWLQEHKYSIFSGSNWLPYLYNEDVIIGDSSTGSGEIWMGKDMNVLLNPGFGNFVNVRFSYKAKYLRDSSVVGIQLKNKIEYTKYKNFENGISLEIPDGMQLLKLICPHDVESINPPREIPKGSYYIKNISRTHFPIYNVWKMSENGDDLVVENGFVLKEGFYNWESNHEFIWSSDVSTIEARSIKPMFLNVKIAARYSPVDEGDVSVSIDGKVITLDATHVAKSRFSIEVLPSDTPHRIEIINLNGSMSPKEMKESNDDRKIALCFSRISLDENADYIVVNQNL